MMCSADVTGSFTPTVAKHTQSVEPMEKKEKNMGNGTMQPLCLSNISIATLVLITLQRLF